MDYNYVSGSSGYLRYIILDEFICKKNELCLEVL